MWSAPSAPLPSSSLFVVLVPRLSSLILFFFHAPATSEIYTLSLHDALPICSPAPPRMSQARSFGGVTVCVLVRSEEHTSELQSLTNLVCRLLLEKKKKSRRGSWTSRNEPTQRNT